MFLLIATKYYKKRNRFKNNLKKQVTLITAHIKLKTKAKGAESRKEKYINKVDELKVCAGGPVATAVGCRPSYRGFESLPALMFSK